MLEACMKVQCNYCWVIAAGGAFQFHLACKRWWWINQCGRDLGSEGGVLGGEFFPWEAHELRGESLNWLRVLWMTGVRFIVYWSCIWKEIYLSSLEQRGNYTWLNEEGIKALMGQGEKVKENWERYKNNQIYIYIRIYITVSMVYWTFQEL